MGMPTLQHVVRVMKESEVDQAPREWQQVKAAYETVNHISAYKATYKPDTPFPTITGQDPTDVDELLLLTDKFTIPAFGSEIVSGQTKKTLMMGSKLQVMMQAHM